MKSKKFDKDYKTHTHKFRTSDSEEEMLGRLMVEKNMNLTQLIMHLAANEYVKLLTK